MRVYGPLGLVRLPVVVFVLALVAEEHAPTVGVGPNGSGVVRFLVTLSDPRHPKQAKHRSVGLLVAVAVAVVMGTLRRPGPASLSYWCPCEGWDLPRGSAGSCGEPATDSSSAASASW